jgi:hypothetical protein
MKPSPEKSKQLFSGTAASAAARHLSRKLQHSVSYLRDKSALPQYDQLTDSSIQIDYVGDTGFPECADTIAYEPTQGLLAIGTTDGRIKLIGRLGVEATLRPASPVPTIYLGFLPNQGALVRVTKDGGIELFSLAAKRLLSSLSLRGEPGGVVSVATLPGAPYILLGCASGNIKVISLLSRTGALAEGCTPAASVKIQPYQILAEDLDSRGGVVALATTSLYTTTSNSSSSSTTSRPLALITHHETGTLVWDIRSERILCAAIDDEEDNCNEATARPTSGCWVGDRANAFAVGYDDGSILVWGVPPQALNSDPLDVIIPHEAELLMSLTVTPPCMYNNNSNSARNERNKKRPGPIREMKFLAGGPPPAGVDEDCLLVCGGQVEGEPEMLVVLPLRPQVEGYPEEGDGHHVVPWFGTIQAFTVVKPVVGVADDDNDEGYYGEESDLALPPPSSSSGGPLNSSTLTQDASSQLLMILTEGGQLVVHDLRHCQPNPVTLPAQELPPITVSKVVDVRVLEEEEEEEDDDDDEDNSHNGGGGGGGMKSSRSKATLYKHTLSLAALRRCSTRLAFGGEEDIAQADWPFHGGKPAPLVTDVPRDYHHPCGLLLTGHRDGRVRVWDTSVAVPQLLHTVPSTATPTGGGNNQLQQNERLRAVSSLDMCPLSGLMIVGHVDGNVRLYQFSDHDSQEVHRSNIDEARVPYEHVGAQAAGFQYVTRYSVHSADVTAVVLASALKLAAVADAKGTVSLVDLMQPNQLFCSRPFTNAVVKLRFGFVPVPYPITTTSSTGTPISTPRPTDSKSAPPPPPPPSPGVEEGLERLVLIAAADDSSIALIDLENGNLIPGSTKPLRPKNTARPLAMALLGPSGEPIGNASLQGKTTLPWANNHEDNVVAGLTRKVLGLSLTSSQRPPLSGSVPAKSWANKIPKTCRNNDDDDEPEQSFTVEQLPSSDDDDEIDSHLAAAAAEVDNSTNYRKFKLKLPNAKGFLPNRKGSNRSDDVDTASPQTTSNNDVQDKSTTPRDAPVTQDPVAALQKFYKGSTAGGSLSSLPPCSTPPQQGKTKGKGEEEEESPPCTFVVLATEDALRVYSTGSIRVGDRTSEKKARLDEAAGFAALFSSPHAGAGIVTIAADGSSLSLYSVPNLQLLAKHTMESSSVLGYPWKNTVGAACACSSDGQLILCGSGSNEIVRVCLLEDTMAPSPPASTFDWAVAKAAAAAMAFVGDGSSSNTNSGGGITQSRSAIQQHTTTLPPVNKSLDTSGIEMKSLSSIIEAVKGTAASVATSAVKAGSAFADSLPAGMASHSSSTSTSASARAPPSLRQLFDTTVTSLNELDLLEDLDDDDDENDDFVTVDSKDGRKKKVASPSPTRLPASRSPLPTPSPPPPVSNREMRNELLGTGSKAKAAAPTFRQAKAHMRTASEIKRNYGRPGATSSTNDKIGGVKGMMEKTRDALVERGEKLKSLQNKSEAMSNDAEDFAGMAQRLEQMYAEKKWWQF